jgi:hypothetical protein
MEPVNDSGNAAWRQRGAERARSRWLTEWTAGEVTVGAEPWGELEVQRAPGDPIEAISEVGLRERIYQGYSGEEGVRKRGTGNFVALKDWEGGRLMAGILELRNREKKGVRVNRPDARGEHRGEAKLETGISGVPAGGGEQAAEAPRERLLREGPPAQSALPTPAPVAPVTTRNTPIIAGVTLLVGVLVLVAVWVALQVS